MRGIVAHSSAPTSTQTTRGKQKSGENGAKHVKEILGRSTHYLFTQIFLSSHPNCCYVPLLVGDDAHPPLFLFFSVLCTSSPQLMLL